MLTNSFLAAEVPDIKFEVSGVKCFYVEALGWHDVLYFLVAERLQNGCLTGVIKAKHTHSHFFLGGCLPSCFTGLVFTPFVGKKFKHKRHHYE